MCRLGLSSDTRAFSALRAVFAFAILSSISSLTQAQEWKELPVDPKLQPKIAFTKLLDGREKMDEEAFDATLKKFILPQMCLLENIPEDAKKPLPELRRLFVVRFVNPARNNPEGLKRLNSVTIDFFKPVISGREFHPAVRSNAVLILGMLNDKYAAAGNAPSAPCRDAFKILSVCVRHPAIPDYLKVNALRGLKRHALYAKGMNVDDRDDLMGTALTLMNQVTPPEGRDPEAHIWMRRRAAEVLANVGRPGRSQEVTKGLLAILSDENSPLSLRCSAAETFGKLNSETQFDVPQTSRILASLALSVCLTERDLLESHGELLARRQLVHQLSQVESGLQAILARDASQEIAAPVSQELNEMIESYKSTAQSIEALHSELGTHCSQLQAVISKSSQTEPAAKTAPASTPAAKASTEPKSTRLSDDLK